MLLNIAEATLPVTDPILKYLIVIIIVLLAPILLNKLKIPHLIGLIIAGALTGPNGFGILDRDSSIVVSGTTGLLYIMFLAGLEIDLIEFKKNKWKSITFGMYTFCIPMLIGTLASYYLLHFNWMTAILLGSLISSHTLLAYPIVSKLGIAKDKSVNIAVGGTMITDTLALLVLAVIVGMTKGQVDAAFWLRLTLSILAFGLIVLFLFPVIGRWFFKKVPDRISQFIFVLVMVYLGAVLAELAGVEGIIGAFLSGLALNRLIPATSPLMNRVEFVGNALFIPFFLISVGMLIDFKAFIKDTETIKVAAVLTIGVITAKYLAAWATTKTFRMNKHQLQVIFGLSLAQAAATLAAVMVGYNIIISETPDGEPIRLLNEAVLNGSILVILITCTIASVTAQKGGQALARETGAETGNTAEGTDEGEKILIATNALEKTEHLVQLALSIKTPRNTDQVYALNIINKHDAPDESDRAGKKMLELAVQTGAAADVKVHDIIRYDDNIINGITGEVKANKITDLILGYSTRPYNSVKSFALINGILENDRLTTYVYNPVQPLSTIKNNIIVIPRNAERETGFFYWLSNIWTLAKHCGGGVKFFAAKNIEPLLSSLNEKNPIQYRFSEFTNWEDILILSREADKNDLIIFVLSRPQYPSYNQHMDRIFTYLDRYFRSSNFLLIYPIQVKPAETDDFYISDQHFLNPTVDLESLGKDIGRIFTRDRKG
ncbi:cation:proton antiporter [Niabella drilacis]|uniref:Kef-type K+ transport system, membrane component KefB n=1 Tax=Niabella drilacis (strain DSM 25811 / CCM 8410 / CCUG 62505 / LMG 26954 / E90) TaxID=1285928 RepID=A0A1G6UYB0_NIADE|nr:cation:proton antiporter [Niabella drilacis]SDD46244.1 Kef-type K+ transport system, membrane component KefB [Niabella drilacis]